MATNKLRDKQVDAARPAERPYKLTDGDGMYLLVDTKGGRYWRLDYRFAGKRKTLPLGPYPDVSLKRARAARDEARQGIRDGIDPAERRKLEKITRGYAREASFESVTREWHREFAPTWTPATAHRNLRVMEANSFPWIGSRPVSELTAPELLVCVRRVKDRGHLDTAHRLLNLIGAVLRFGVRTGRCERNVAGDLRGALPANTKVHRPAFTDERDFGKLLAEIWRYHGQFHVACALRLSALFALRPGEIRKMEWTEIDAGERLVRIELGKMKSRRPHLVPISDQAMEIINELRPLTGHGQYCFPGAQDRARPMSENTAGAALRRMGYCTKEEHTPHGFRATFATLAHGSGLWRPECVEVQLAHKHGDATRLAYDRGDFLEERRRLMAWWAGECERMRKAAENV